MKSSDSQFEYYYNIGSPVNLNFINHEKKTFDLFAPVFVLLLGRR